MADKEGQSEITINIKSTREKMEMKVLPDMTVKELKKVLKEKLGSGVTGELCLIFSGKILKDEECLKTHGIVKDGLTLHLVLRGPKTTPPTSSTPATSSPNSSSQAPSQSATPSGGSGTFNPFGGMGGGLPPSGDMHAQMQQHLMNNPEVMQQMLNSPMMQNLMSNPDTLQSLFTSNPQMQQLMERNPELSHILNNPDLMRQALEMARNPGAMREMMRSQDRQLSNIESLPGGFNALARMYSEIQEPMMDAAQESLQQQVQSNPFAALFSGSQQQQNASQPGPSVPQGTANTAPLPNPWGGGSTTQSSNGSSASTGQSGGQTSSGNGTTAGVGGVGGGMGGVGGAGLGGQTAEMMRMFASNPEMMRRLTSGQLQGMSPMELMQDPGYRQLMSQMMQNPEYRQSLSQLMANPQALQTMMQSFPGMESMLGGQDIGQLAQQTSQMMNNPQMMDMMANPEAFQGYMNMVQGYNQMTQSMPGSAGLLANQQVPTSSSSSTTSGEGGANAPPPSNEALLQMMQQMQQMMGGAGMGGTGMGGAGMGGVGSSVGGVGGGTSAGQNPGETQAQAAERKYRIQLETLERMGFPDRSANIEALMNSGGDINAAIDKLIKF